jgi:hypothetical protein
LIGHSDELCGHIVGGTVIARRYNGGAAAAEQVKSEKVQYLKYRCHR